MPEPAYEPVNDPLSRNAWLAAAFRLRIFRSRDRNQPICSSFTDLTLRSRLWLASQRSTIFITIIFQNEDIAFSPPTSGSSQGFRLLLLLMEGIFALWLFSRPVNPVLIGNRRSPLPAYRSYPVIRRSHLVSILRYSVSSWPKRPW
jgi:hypothetical protein